MTGRLLAIVLAGLALLGGGYRWGATATHNHYEAQAAQQLRADAAAKDAEMRRADKASGHLQAELLEQTINHEKLEKAFHDYKKRRSLLARSAAAPAGQAAGDATPTPQCITLAAGAEPALSLGAVWMWNSALAGIDAPAGACGLDDQSEEACAADASVTLDDAWRNQALNAKLCAQDRARHQNLIDFLKGRTQ